MSKWKQKPQIPTKLNVGDRVRVKPSGRGTDYPGIPLDELKVKQGRPNRQLMTA